MKLIAKQPTSSGEVYSIIAYQIVGGAIDTQICWFTLPMLASYNKHITEYLFHLILNFLPKSRLTPFYSPLFSDSYLHTTFQILTWY